MSVTAIIVTRGDVDLTQIIQSIPKDWQCLVWNNGSEKLLDYDLANHYTTFSRATWFEVEDLSVYGRYAAIEHAVGDLIYVQDDDCIVEDPAYIVDTFMTAPAEAVICNMPQEFRHSFYEDHALVGFGAAFHRDAFDRAMWRFAEGGGAAILAGSRGEEEQAFWRRTCDIVFTGLTPRVLVDVPKFDLPWANDDNRMWKQPTHQAERARMLDLMRGVRDAA